MSEAKEDLIGVGYGQPPTSGQFKKGRSGNLKGRPKNPDPSVIDLNATLTHEVQVNGAPMDVREVELRQQVKKALDPKGSLKSMRHVIEVFERCGALKPPEQKQYRPELPSIAKFPWSVQLILIKQGGTFPWTEARIKKAKAAYLQTRDEGDRRHDVAAGYEEWLMA